jgi:CubicO group peptidase (beta-lactamase class C family)
MMTYQNDSIRGMKMMQTMPRCSSVKSLTVAILFAFSANVAWSRQAEPDQVDDFVKQRMRELHIPGLSLAVVKEGRIVKARGYGVANVETSSLASPETVYKAASLSKPFIAAAEPTRHGFGEGRSWWNGTSEQVPSDLPG